MTKIEWVEKLDKILKQGDDCLFDGCTIQDDCARCNDFRENMFKREIKLIKWQIEDER